MNVVYEALLKDPLAGYWERNINSGVEFLSPAFKAMLGYSDNELSEASEIIKKLILPEDAEKEKKNFHEHIDSGGQIPYTGEIRYKHKEGYIIWMKYSGRVISPENDASPKLITFNFDITKQKRTEEELEAVKTFLTKTNEAAKIGAWEVDLIKGSVYWSDFTKKIHEVEDSYIPDLESGINFYKEGDNRDLITEVFSRLVEFGTPFDEELLIVTANGKEKWVRSIGNAEIVDGKCVKAFGTFQDIDDDIQIRGALSESEQRFRESFENAEIGMALVSPEGNWMRVNKKLCEITGYNKEELLQINFQDITHPDDLNTDLKNVQKLLTGDINGYQMEKRYYHKNGHLIWVLLHVSIVKSESGTPLHFVSQIEDITEKKLADEKLKKVNNELTSLFDAITHVSVIATDLDGTIRHFSTGAETLLGYTAEEMIGKTTPAIIHIEDEVIERGKELSDMFNKKIEGFDAFVERAKHGNHDSREWTYVRKDGTTFPVQLVITAIKNENGEITGYIGIATDISDIKKTQTELQNSIDIVSEQNKRLFNFAHIVSHNLRSHSGNLSLLLELYTQSSSKEEKEEIYSHLQSLSVNLSETILHLNEIVSIQTNINVQRKELKLYDFVEKTIELLAVDINHTNAVVTNNVPKNTIISYNEAYMESILYNFMSNALKYRSRERLPLIDISYVKATGNGVMIISDNGIGIDLKRHRRKMFGMYKTFHGNEDAKGIGLFITNNQVEAMGGKIEVKSEVDKGTTFKIFL